MALFAAIQLTSNQDFHRNLAKVRNLTEQAAALGAKVVALPEMFTYIGGGTEVPPEYTFELTSPLVEGLCSWAQRFQVYLVAGSFHEKIVASPKFYNTSLLISPQGEILSLYRKIHLFDIQSPAVTIKESERFESGAITQSEVIATPYGHLGVTICYDLRFPELYRSLALKGAHIIFVPAAFTLPTGKDHWEVLLRARAIENQVYIVAPNQFGSHNVQRQSYGNSMIVDPWGKVLARASDKEGLIIADIDLSYQEQVRQNLPCLQHRRLPV